jgi:type I restriction enzyme S subunit
MTNRPPLPSDWIWTTIGEITNPERNRVKPQDYPYLSFVGMEKIEAHTMRLLGTVPASEMKSTAEYFQPDDVLYGRLRPYLNKVFRADFEGLCSSEFIAFRSTPHLESKYLQYFLNSSEFVAFASSLNTGDRPRINFHQIADYPFPLPPLAEQHRIVEAIETQFTRLDAGVAGLEQVRAKLRRYRAAVLKAACEGRLVPQDPTDEPAAGLLARIFEERRIKWELAEREKMRLQGKNPEKETLPTYKKPSTVDKKDLPDLPDGWTWTSLDTLTYFTVDYRGKTPPTAPEGTPIISSANVRSGKIVAKMPRFVDDATYKKWTQRGIPQPGDLIITTEAPVGEVALYPKEGAYVLTRRIFACQTVEVDNQYLIYSFWAQPTRKYLDFHSRGTTVPRILKPLLMNTPIPLPPLAEQQRIVAEVERRLSVVEEVEAAIDANLKRAARLRQAILKKAFVGELVPQNPADEPASVLLERIRAEKLDGKKGRQMSLPGV